MVDAFIEDDSQRDVTSRRIMNNAEITAELDESSDQSTFPETPQKKRTTRKRVQKGAVPSRKTDEPLPQVVTTTSFTGRHSL